MKFWKYGRPYFAVISNRRSAFGESQSKSFVMLYVGIGKVKTLPSASPSAITSMNARLIMSISGCRSPYVKSVGSPPIKGTSSRRSSGQTQSNVRFVNGHWLPHREATFRLKISSCMSCFTWSKLMLSRRTKGAM